MAENESEREVGTDGRGAGASAGDPSDPSRRPDDEFPGVDQLIGTFLREASLWPVLAVVIGSGGAFAAALVILAFVDRNPFAALALLLIFGMTVDVVHRSRREPRYRNGARLLLSIWAVGLAFVGVAVWTGIAYPG